MADVCATLTGLAKCVANTYEEFRDLLKSTCNIELP